jgi:hypothetical protein
MLYVKQHAQHQFGQSAGSLKLCWYDVGCATSDAGLDLELKCILHLHLANLFSGTALPSFTSLSWRIRSVAVTSTRGHTCMLIIVFSGIDKQTR